MVCVPATCTQHLHDHTHVHVHHLLAYSAAAVHVAAADLEPREIWRGGGFALGLAVLLAGSPIRRLNAGGNVKAGLVGGLDGSEGGALTERKTSPFTCSRGHRVRVRDSQG